MCTLNSFCIRMVWQPSYPIWLLQSCMHICVHAYVCVCEHHTGFTLQYTHVHKTKYLQLQRRDVSGSKLQTLFKYGKVNNKYYIIIC